MRSSLRIKTTVLPGHRIEFSSPELKDGEAVDVLITRLDSKLGSAPPLDRLELLKLSVSERRTVLAQQADLLQSEYGPDPEREAWQGGDIVAD